MEQQRLLLLLLLRGSSGGGDRGVCRRRRRGCGGGPARALLLLEQQHQLRGVREAGLLLLRLPLLVEVLLVELLWRRRRQARCLRAVGVVLLLVRVLLVAEV